MKVIKRIQIANPKRTQLPGSYRRRCKQSGHRPMTADYAVWLINSRGLRPAIVPADFTDVHLGLIPADERKRWLRTARRREMLAKRRAA